MWRDMAALQEAAAKATDRIRARLEWLSQQYERNQMASEFMSNRVVAIAKLVAQLTTQHQKIDEGLRASLRRGTGEEETPVQLLDRRRTMAGRLKDDQQIATVMSELLLGKIYDWRDLQYAVVTITEIIDEQEDVTHKNEELSPPWRARVAWR